MEDSCIVELYWRRDEDAVRETQRKYGAFCLGIARNILSSAEDAQECVNTVYLQAWNAIPPQRPLHLQAWLGKITRNTAINLWNRRHTQKRNDGLTVMLEELEDCLPAAQTVEGRLEQEELAAHLSRWLRSLAPADRVLFVRRYWYGMPLRDLAAERRISPQKLAQHMLRLRQKLKKYLEKEGISL